MRKIVGLFTMLFCASTVTAQNIDIVINAAEVERIEKTLSADDMQGRRTFTPGIDKAAAFIADEFKKSGLQTFKQNGNFLQSFNMVRAKFLSASANFDGNEIETKNIITLTCKPDLLVNEKSGYELVRITKTDNFNTEARKYSNMAKNYIVLVDSSFSANFSRLIRMKSNMFQTNNSVIFILSQQIPTKFTVQSAHEIIAQPLSNVVGIIPGKSLPNEYVIFSGHYDHLGIDSKRAVNNDSIYNGANDDAAGTTAVMLLAKYYRMMNNNERTLVFAAFTAEEVGGFGATYFSKQFNPEDVKAMFNIEMIGTESKWGANSAYITGFEKTDMGTLLQKNLTGTSFNFYPDPYPDQNLFYRSDNATLARLGVPAHTISTSKMDSEANYHKVSDEIGTLNIPNMTQIIKSIALSARGIVSGKETPSRVDVSALK